MCSLLSTFALLATFLVAASSARAQSSRAEHALQSRFDAGSALQWNPLAQPTHANAMRATAEQPSLVATSVTNAAAPTTEATYSRLSSQMLHFMQPGKDFVEPNASIRSMHASPLFLHGFGAAITFHTN